MDELIELDLFFSPPPDLADSDAPDSDSDLEFSTSFSASEKGKGKAVNQCKLSESEDELEDDTDSESDSDEELNHQSSKDVEIWESREEINRLARIKANGVPIQLPAVNSTYASSTALRVDLAAYAIQNQINVATIRGQPNLDGSRRVQISCSKQSCLWKFKWKVEIIGGEIMIYQVNLEHNHSMLPQELAGKISRKVIDFKFPRNGEIVAKAESLIKNTPEVIQQHLNLSFKTATEMRVHITAYAIRKGFAVNHSSSTGPSNGFELRCARGRRKITGTRIPCPYRFISNWNEETERWVVKKLVKSHDHKMGEMEMVGSTTRLTAKGKRMREEAESIDNEKRNGENNSNKLKKKRIIKELESDEEVLHPRSTPDIASSRNESPEEKIRHSKRPKIARNSPSPIASTSDSHRSTSLAATTSRSVPSIHILPISSPEWIAELTVLITAIDHRLSNLVPIFDNAGVKNERAVKEMLNFSEEGLIRLTEKLMVPVAGMPIMTIMQGIWFKKGVKKIREGIA